MLTHGLGILQTVSSHSAHRPIKFLCVTHFECIPQIAELQRATLEAGAGLPAMSPQRDPTPPASVHVTHAAATSRCDTPPLAPVHVPIPHDSPPSPAPEPVVVNQLSKVLGHLFYSLLLYSLLRYPPFFFSFLFFSFLFSSLYVFCLSYLHSPCTLALSLGTPTPPLPT